MLAGKLCVQAGGDIMDVPVGSGIMVLRGTKHTYWNLGTEPVRYFRSSVTPTILG